MDAIERVKDRFVEIRQRYVFDRREMAKIMIVVSVTLLLFSGHTVMTLSSSLEEMDSFRQEYRELGSIIGSDSFNESLQTIRDIPSAAVQVRVAAAVQSFQDTQATVGAFDAAMDRLEGAQARYQWIFLLSLLGLVAGIVELYI